MKEGKFEPRSGLRLGNISWNDEQQATRKFAKAAKTLKIRRPDLCPASQHGTRKLPAARSAQDAPQHAAKYLPSDLAADGARRLFGHCFH